MDKSMYGKMSDDRRTKESPTCGLANRPTKEGVMKEEKQQKDAEIEYIINLLKKASPEKVHKMFIGATVLLG